MTMELIDRNLKECWELYTEYLEQFKKEHYSNQKPMDFVDFCENELTICPNCGEVVLKDDIDISPLNCDEVCVYCINEGGYYE